MEERGFAVETSLNRGRAVIAVTGEIDMATVDGLNAALAAVVGADEVWVDLTEVGFMDSTGLSALVSGHRALDGRFVVVCPDGAARRALDVSGLDELIHVRHSTSELG
jgi:anti-sigma B factor antagonist